MDSVEPGVLLIVLCCSGWCGTRSVADCVADCAAVDCVEPGVLPIVLNCCGLCGTRSVANCIGLLWIVWD